MTATVSNSTSNSTGTVLELAWLAQAWSDTIVGSSDWVSNTGEHYNLPNDFQYYWANPSGNIAASNTNTSPGPEFAPLTPANVR